MKKLAITSIALSLLLSMIILVIANPGDISKVYVNPEEQTVEIGDYVEIEIYTNLTEPISGWELDLLSFSSDILHLNSISEGNLLSNVGGTSFNNGSIDNANGTAKDFFCFTYGESSSDEGSLCVLNFTAKNIGSSSIDFDVLLSFEGSSVPYTSQNGTITIIETQPPSIVDNSPSVAYTGNSYEFNVDATDSDGVFGVWVEYWYNGTPVVNHSMTKTGERSWTHTIQSISSSHDSLHYIISAEDNNNNWNTTSTRDISIEDDDAPIILNIDISDIKQYVNDSLNITVTATDNKNIAEIYINITNPNSITHSYLIVGNKIGDDYYLDSSYQIIGNYSMVVFVKDETGNYVLSSSYNFYIYPQYDLDKNGKININDVTSVTAHYGEEGTPRWIIQDINLPYPDGEININDITRVTGHYGEEYTELMEI